MAHSTFFPPTNNMTDTCSLTPGLFDVTTTGGLFTPKMVGQQFRPGGVGGSFYPTFTIASYISPSHVLLDTPWIGPVVTGSAYNVFQCYFTVPSDFQSFVSMVNLTSNYRLWTNLTQAELDMADPQRIQIGISFATAFYDYTQTFSGTVGPALQVIGTGASPVATTGTGFTFPANSVYTVQITQSGAVGTAKFIWRQDGLAFSPAQTVVNSNPIQLSNGVAVYFPAGNYTNGDVFVISCTAGSVTGNARYEIWPRPINTPYVYPYIYRKIPPPLTDDQPQLPPPIAQRGDVILEMALEKAALWPGTDTSRNPYYSLQQAAYHARKAEFLINELERKDDDTATKNQMYHQFPFAANPFVDGSWLQTHALYPTP